jgi:hypothetical protein
MPISRGLRLLPSLALLVLLACALAPASPALAASSDGCPNEQIRAESNVNPATGQPYSLGLPECRAYEMVSPLEKQQHAAIRAESPVRNPVAPEGDAIGWTSEGDYAGADNYQAHGFQPTNPYIASRTPAGWITRSAYPPADLIAEPFGNGIGASVSPSLGAFTPSLSDESVCGFGTLTESLGTNVVCALREPSESWHSTPAYRTVSGASLKSIPFVGASRDLNVEVFEDPVLTAHFLSADTRREGACNPSVFSESCDGIYEITGVGTASPELHLVNVDSSGNMIGPESPAGIGAGANLNVEVEGGSDYQAISADGAIIYFTATPTGGVPTVYARINNTETVAVSQSNPTQCTEVCAEAEAQPALYQGASANGQKVFFTTSQPLVNGDTDTTEDLYEYNFAAPPAQRLVQVSRGGLGDGSPGSGAEVRSVLSISEDGSHVYFSAYGVLTTLPNGLGETATKGAFNIYGYDTETGETKFVASLSEQDTPLGGAPVRGGNSAARFERQVQTTPDGEFLVFSSYAKLITTGPESDTDEAQDVYRYDFQTDRLNRISISHNNFGDNGNKPGFNAIIAPVASKEGGAMPDINDVNRAISTNGKDIVFSTSEQLAGNDVAGGTDTSCIAESANTAGCEVYLWHECTEEACADGDAGEVNLISSGTPVAKGATAPVISSTGGDIFFQTENALVAQDTDELGDIYDARIDGGFPAPTPPPSCGGEACQGAPGSSPAFASPGSNSFSGGGNLTAGSTAFPAPVTSKPKPLTKAQELTKALKQCKRDKKKAKRLSCERTAHKKFGAAPKKRAASKKG